MRKAAVYPLADTLSNAYPRIWTRNPSAMSQTLVPPASRPPGEDATEPVPDRDFLQQPEPDIEYDQHIAW